MSGASQLLDIEPLDNSMVVRSCGKKQVDEQSSGCKAIGHMLIWSTSCPGGKRVTHTKEDTTKH